VIQPRNTGNCSPQGRTVELLNDLVQRIFALESDHGVEFWNVSQQFGRFEGSIVSADGEMCLHPGGSQRANHRRELRNHVLEDQGKSYDIRSFGLNDAQ